ncbi:DEAD/DEAH box helicase [Kallotenue papyrolyticum]|uniref:DEAD/DEAH box helicase n=1 Tax=Kallotenue papyrolyticum TaxID=1325125 RepID=UPI0004785580|nr:DEAD/DEAH box helicase [Kallotenue papyrolyticum]
MTLLPVETVLPELRRALASPGAAVLTAPPGAGKTTLVPLALLNEPWLGGRRVLMLEPRRLAARAAARRMADMLGERTGDTVGYRMRAETKVGPRTRVEVVTEGVLTRLLQADPTLDGYGIVIFDEFHERSLEADLGLAFCLDIRSKLRDDLRILVMSATLQSGPVSALLGGAPVIVCEGRSYPVETFYLDRSVAADEFETAVARVIGRAWNLHGGDMLVFLPGAREIRRVGDLLRDAGWSREALIVPLHGSLPQKDQDAALEPPPPGKRKAAVRPCGNAAHRPRSGAADVAPVVAGRLST